MKDIYIYLKQELSLG